jgi:hypothetical protein
VLLILLGLICIGCAGLLVRKTSWRSRAIKELKVNQKREQEEWRNRVKKVLVARDNIKIIIEGENSTIRDHTKADYMDKLITLDDELKDQSGKVFRTKNLEELKAIYKPKTEDWWWHPAPPQDYLDWLWKLPVFVSILWSIYLNVDLASRFWTGGFFGEGSGVLLSIIGGLAAIVPALVGILLGGETSQFSAKLESRLKVLGIPRRYWREVIIIVSGIFFLSTCGVHGKMPDFANNFYTKGSQLAFTCDEREILDPNFKASSEKSCAQKSSPDVSKKVTSSKDLPEVVKAEGLLKIARSLDPDNPKISFALGFLHELQQDTDNARKEYRISARNGYMLGRIRLARLYLRDSEPLKTAKESVLSETKAQTDTQKSSKAETPLENKPPVLLPQAKSADTAISILLEEGEPTDEESMLTRESWYVTSAWARLQQGRDLEAKQDIDLALSLIDEINKDQKLTLEQKEISSSIVYCLKAESLERSYKTQDKEKIMRIKFFWEKCKEETNQRDFYEDAWFGKAYKRSRELS